MDAPVFDPDMSPVVAAAKALLSPTAALNRHVPVSLAAESRQQSRVEQRRYGFRVGGMGFLTGPQVGCEAMALQPVSPIPNSMPWLHGVMNLRGALVPIFDLRLALGLTGPERNTQSAILVFDKGPLAAGVLTEGYPLPLANLMPMKQIPELPAALSGGVVAAGFTVADEVWLELDHARLFQSLKNGAGH